MGFCSATHEPPPPSLTRRSVSMPAAMGAEPLWVALYRASVPAMRPYFSRNGARRGCAASRACSSHQAVLFLFCK